MSTDRKVAIQIRPMTGADITQCSVIMAEAPLWQRYNVTMKSASTRFQIGLSEPDSHLFVAISENTPDAVAGFVWLVVRGTFHRSGYIPLIAVAPEARGGSIGHRLLLHAEGYFRPLCKDLFLLCSDFNQDAQRFYLREGFVQVGSIPDYVIPGITELIFRKQL